MARRETDHEGFIGDETAQAGPAAVHALDREIGVPLNPVGGDGKVKFLGLGVAGRRRCLVGRASQEAAGLGFDIPAFVDRDGRRHGL